MNWLFILGASIIFYILSKKIIGNENKFESLLFTLYLTGVLYIYNRFFNSVVEAARLYSFSDSI